MHIIHVQPCRRTPVSVQIRLIDTHERLLTPPAVTFFGTLRRLPVSEILSGLAFGGLMAILLIAMAVFS